MSAQNDYIWLRKNNFTKLDNAIEFPVQYVCKVCDLISNSSNCSRCSEKYTIPVISKPSYSIYITWMKWL